MTNTKTIWQTQSRESGDVIDEFGTEEAAETAIEEYEAEDHRDGNYTPEFYAVVEVESNSHVETVI